MKENSTLYYLFTTRSAGQQPETVVIHNEKELDLDHTCAELLDRAEVTVDDSIMNALSDYARKAVQK